MSKITVTTIAGATSGADANKVKIESGDTLEVTSNATVGGTLTTTGATALNGGATVLGNTIVNPDTAGKSTFQFTSQAANDAKLIMKSDTTEKVTIHANGTTVLNGGSVTMPSQPAFHIQGTGSAHTGGSETAIGYASTPTIKYNIGNHGVGGTGATSGRFTCPVAGIYLVSCTWYRGNTGSPSAYMGTIVKKNGATFYSYWYNNAASYGDASVGQTGMIQCAANDVLQQYVYGASADSDPTTTMQIYLLG